MKYKTEGTHALYIPPPNPPTIFQGVNRTSAVSQFLEIRNGFASSIAGQKRFSLQSCVHWQRTASKASQIDTKYRIAKS